MVLHTDISDLDECSLFPLSVLIPSLVNPTCHHQPMSSDTNWTPSSRIRTSSSTAGLCEKSSHPSLCLSVCTPGLQCASLGGRMAGFPDRTLWRSREDRLPVRAPGCVCLMSGARWSVCWHCQEAKDVSGSFVFHLSTPGSVHFPENFWNRQMHWHDVVRVNTVCLTHGWFELVS